MGLKYDEKMTIYLNKDLKYQLEKYSDANGIKVSGAIRQIIIDYFKD